MFVNAAPNPLLLCYDAIFRILACVLCLSFPALCVAMWCTSRCTVLLSSAQPPTARPTILPIPLSAWDSPSFSLKPRRSSIPAAFSSLSLTVVARPFFD